DERSLGGAQRLQRPHRADLATALQANRQGHFARPSRHVSQGQLSGFRPLLRYRHGGRGRRRGFAPGAHRGGRRLIDPGRQAAYETRGRRYAAARLAMLEQAKSDATIGWDSTPITTGRMCAEVYAQIKDQDWSLVGNTIGNVWPMR